MPFPDSIAALQRLSNHYKMVILSNVDQQSFASTLENLTPWVPDLVLTAEEIGSYKPAQQNFLTMLDVVSNKFEVEKDDVLVVAQSLYADHQPANALGIKSVWIDRNGDGIDDELRGIRYDWTFSTLSEMANCKAATALPDISTPATT